MDVRPGTYRTDGPDGGNDGGCYWSRSTPAGRLIGNGVLVGPGTLTLARGDRIDSAGCRPWRRSV